MLRIVGEQPPQIAIVGFRRVDGVERALLLVIFAERLGELAERIDLFPVRQHRPLAGDLPHQLVDIFELLERRPAGIARAPMRARPQPHREGFGEILVRMALRVPQPQMLDVIAARRIGPVIARIALRRRTEQLLPAAAAIKLIGVGDDMAAFVPQNAHAFATRCRPRLRGSFSFPAASAADAPERTAWRCRACFRGKTTRSKSRHAAAPGCRARRARRKALQAFLEPGALDRHLEVLEPDLQQLVVGQRRPRKLPLELSPGFLPEFPTRHG